MIENSRFEQFRKTHTEMFNLCEVYLDDLLIVIKQNRIDASFIDTLDRIKELYKNIQNTKEKQ